VSGSGIDRAFGDSIALVYETDLVPLIFQPYAADLANRLAATAPARVLEVAAGTGVATRALAAVLPPTTAIVATDLNQAMLDRAAAVGISRPVEWRQADAMRLPFEDGTFDTVVCQFGMMFFPDKPAAFSEVWRVLRPGGRFVFSVWDRIEWNEFADTVTTALAALFPHDPPRFLARTPHGYHDRTIIERDLAQAGFDTPPRFETVTAQSRASSARVPAVGYCQGTPLRNEIVAQGASRLAHATDVAADAVAQRFGAGPVDAQIQAHLVSINKAS
jgi:SAM-dependent methyltransferase